MKRVASRRNRMVSKCSLVLFLFELDPTFIFEIVIAVWNITTAELSDIFTASGRM